MKGSCHETERREDIEQVTRSVRKSSVFPASPEQVWSRLLELKTLQYIASPYVSFTPLDGSGELIWQEGRSFRFRLRVCGLIPLGTHTIRVLRFDRASFTVYTNEGNPFVPIWNHRITLEAAGRDQTRYTDQVEIGAGWKTWAIYAWACCFYAHRQKRWLSLLQRTEENRAP